MVTANAVGNLILFCSEVRDKLMDLLIVSILELILIDMLAVSLFCKRKEVSFLIRLFNIAAVSNELSFKLILVDNVAVSIFCKRKEVSLRIRLFNIKEVSEEVSFKLIRLDKVRVSDKFSLVEILVLIGVISNVFDAN